MVKGHTYIRDKKRARVISLSRVCDTISLFTWSKQKWLFWRAGFHPANQSNL